MKVLNLTWILLVATAQFALAQAPNWSINPNQYQYNMSVTAVANLNCTELSNPANQIGAFVNDTLRGYANTSTVINGRYQVSMLVYSNVVNGEMVKFKFYDQAGNQLYESIDSIAFQNNALYGSPAAPLNIRNNNRPAVLALSYDTLTEGQPTGTLVGLLSTIDADLSQTHFYSLASGTGDADNSRFAIVNDSLKSNVVANFDNRTNFNIRLATTDDLGCSLEQSFVIKVKNQNDAPTAINLSSNLINENNAANAIVAFLSAVDNDPNENFNFQLVSGMGDADNGAFTISNNELRTNQVFDFESKDTFRIRLSVTDAAANSLQQSFLILVQDLNEAPTALAISSDSIAENLPQNTIIANLSSADPDASQNFSYSFDPVAGNDNALFNIVGNNLRTRSVFDFEALSTYIIYIQTRDQGGLTFSQQFTIRIIDANDAPSDIQLSNNTIDESAVAGTFIGLVSSTDADANSTFNYSLVSGPGGTDNGNFQLSNDSLFSAQVFSFNQKPTHSIRVRSTDNGNANFEKNFTIQVNDVNNAPTDLFLSNPIILENTTRGSVVGNLTTQDPDQGDSHTYTLVTGSGDADNNSFIISNGNLLTDTTFNVNLQASYSIRVRTTDAQGLNFEKVIGLSITNANDAPSDISLSNDTIDENLSGNSLVGQFSTVDPDVNDLHSYSFVNLSANDNANFAIVGSELRTTASFDFETKSSYVVQVQTDDGNGGFYAKQLFISIRDVNDAPTGISLSANDADEKQTTDQYVGVFTTTDQDAADSFTYSLVAGTGGTDNASFRISNDSLFATGNFDVLVRNQLSIRLNSTDLGGQSTVSVFSINVIDVNDAPSSISLSNNSIPENSTLNSAVGLFSTSDIDPNQTFTYSLVSGTGDADNANFSISGQELRTNTLYDFNAQPTHSIRLRSTDQGGLSVEQVFTITISNTNDAPTDISLSPAAFNENLPQGTVISTLSTVDADLTDRFSYSFVNQGTNDNANFIIAGDEVRTAASFDFETKSLYIIEVQTRDQAGATYSRQLTLNVLDTNDAPTALSISADSLTEKSPIGTFIADLTTVDEDATDNHTYSLIAGRGSDDNALFRINGNLLESDSVLNFNNKAQRNIRIRSTDKDGLFVEADYVINIKNSNDTPSDIILSDTTANENDLPGSRIATISTVDEDRNDSFTYELVAGSGDADNASFMIVGSELQNMINFDFESQAAYNIRLRTTDSQGSSFEKAFVIALENGNEAPEIDNQFFTVAENSPLNTVIGQLQASDRDAGDSFTFSLISGQTNFGISPDGELRSLRTLDYEVQRNYSIQVLVTDAGGLTDTAEVQIEVLDQIEASLPAASYFSPNGDGLNDTWSIQNVELYTDYRLVIFSAAGEAVLEVPANYNNDWDGTFGSKQMAEGIYYYYFEDNKDPNNNFRGTITLKR